MRKILASCLLILFIGSSINIFAKCPGIRYSRCFIYAYYRNNDTDENIRCTSVKAFMLRKDKWILLSFQKDMLTGEHYIKLRPERTYNLKLEGCDRQAEFIYQVKCENQQGLPYICLQ